MIVKGHRPDLALLVEIEQIFFHCMKAFMRSQLWEPQTWAPDALPSYARLIKSVQPTEETVEELERRYGPGYAKGLYG
jgi:predicted pyridoxine 5'-phosphate oxidase superfamily flavin-nucleotide-binding protein